MFPSFLLFFLSSFLQQVNDLETVDVPGESSWSLSGLLGKQVVGRLWYTTRYT